MAGNSGSLTDDEMFGGQGVSQTPVRNTNGSLTDDELFGDRLRKEARAAERDRDRTPAEVAKDFGLSIGVSGNQLVGMGVGAVAPDSKAAKYFQDSTKRLQGDMSAPSRLQMEDAKARVAEAAKNGEVDALITGLDAYTDNFPVMQQLVTENLLSSLGPAIAGKVMQVYTASRNAWMGAAAAKEAAARAGMVGAGAAGSVVTGGDARQQSYDDVYKTATDQGATAEEAHAQALRLSKGALAAGAVIGAAPLGLNKVLFGNKTGGNIASRAIIPTIEQTAKEVTEEVVPLAAGNLAVKNWVDPNRKITENFGDTIASTMVSMGPVAAGTGALGAVNLRNEQRPIARPAPDTTKPDENILNKETLDDVLAATKESITPRSRADTMQSIDDELPSPGGSPVNSDAALLNRLNKEGKPTPIQHSTPLANMPEPSSVFDKHRVHPITGIERPHNGFDYPAPQGTAVQSTADGIVTFSGHKKDYGNVVIIQHPNGEQTLYGHLHGITEGLKVGNHVTQGAVIGGVGATGKATGNHLHYERIADGTPYDYLKAKQAATIAQRDTQTTPARPFNADGTAMDIDIEVPVSADIQPITEQSQPTDLNAEPVPQEPQPEGSRNVQDAIQSAQVDPQGLTPENITQVGNNQEQVAATPLATDSSHSTVNDDLASALPSAAQEATAAEAIALKEPSFDAPESEWVKYRTDYDALYGKEDLIQAQVAGKSIEQQKLERTAERAKERDAIFALLPISVRRAADYRLERVALGLDKTNSAYNTEQDASDGEALRKFRLSANKKQLSALSLYENRDQSLPSPLPVSAPQEDTQTRTPIENRDDQFRPLRAEILKYKGEGKTNTGSKVFYDATERLKAISDDTLETSLGAQQVWFNSKRKVLAKNGDVEAAALFEQVATQLKAKIQSVKEPVKIDSSVMQAAGDVEVKAAEVVDGGFDKFVTEHSGNIVKIKGSTDLYVNSADGLAMWAVHKDDQKNGVLTKPINTVLRQVYDKFVTSVTASNAKPQPTQKTKRKVATPKTMSMLQFVASIGGFNRASIAAEIGRLDDMKRHKTGIFGSPAFRVTGGEHWDRIGEALAEAGYLPKNEHGQYEKSDLMERLTAELSGDKQYKFDDIIDNAEAEKVNKELDDLRTEAESVGVDWKKYKTADDLYIAIDEKKFDLDDAESKALESVVTADSADTDFDFGTPVSAAETEAWLKGVDDEQGKQGNADGTPAREQSQGNQRSAERGSAQGEAQQQNAAGEFALTSQSNSEIIAQEEAAKKAEQEEGEAVKNEQAAKDKADIEARKKKRAGDAENFVFGESSKDAAQPMGSLFNQTSQEAKPQPESKPTYTAPLSVDDSKKRWNGDFNGKEFVKPERGQNQIALMESVSKALDAGLTYNREIDSFVAKDLGVTDEQRKAGLNEVEGGAFGYDVYLARKEVAQERTTDKNISLGKEFNLKVGENIGKVKLQDGKLASAATVEEISDTRVTLTAKRGPQTVRLEMDYIGLEYAAERAENNYLSKKTKPETEVSRAKEHSATPDVSNIIQLKEIPRNIEIEVEIEGGTRTVNAYQEMKSVNQLIKKYESLRGCL